MEFVLKKKFLVSWPRLLEGVPKPQWLKVDFDRIKQELESSSNDSEAEEIANRSPATRTYRDRNFGRGRKNRGKNFQSRENILTD